ncbi:hypothetical protein NC651_001634 [Populus alba x Populus x berolinensis]|nr:hypothetical protein NC651_001634 [Populus alba x Populus x berolinensis]
MLAIINCCYHELKCKVNQVLKMEYCEAATGCCLQNNSSSPTLETCSKNVVALAISLPVARMKTLRLL